MIFFDHERRRELLPTSLSGPEVQSAKDVIEMHRERSKGEREQTDLPPVWKQPLGRDVIDMPAGRQADAAEQQDRHVSPRAEVRRPPTNLPALGQLSCRRRQ